nr:MAG TPA: hypothetical protein [Crassvirales sp.]
MHCRHNSHCYLIGSLSYNSICFHIGQTISSSLLSYIIRMPSTRVLFIDCTSQRLVVELSIYFYVLLWLSC